MDISPKTETFGTDDQSWLASRHGVNNARSVTLKTADFTANTHYPAGYLKSGIPLKKNGDGTYSPWTAATVFAGVLLTHVKAPASTSTNVVGPMLSHCRVVEAKLVGTVPDATGKATNPGIQFV